MQTKPIEIIEYKEYVQTVPVLLHQLGMEDRIKGHTKIVIKPNLLDNAPAPCTTDKTLVEEVIKYIREATDLEIVLIEGSGGCKTKEAFEHLGYNSLEKKYGIKLVDTDHAELVKLKNSNALAYKEVYLPEVIFDSFFISIAPLKDHLITKVTLSIKNLIGLLPKKYYGGYWHYNRSDVHRVGVDKAIIDLYGYVHIDLAIIDGSIGQQHSHLPGGRSFNPPKNKIIAGYDCLEADKKGAELLGHDWQSVTHLKCIDGLKGGK
jgi:uncharacterized protein (DUF362 family)